jgi:phospholipid-binding lipoprotein MlaA
MLGNQTKKPDSRVRAILGVVTASLIFATAALAQMPPSPWKKGAPLRQSAEGTNSIVFPAGFNDPIEPFNRAIWGFNQGFSTWVVKPASKTYRRVVFKPVRTGIGNMGKNLTFPGRLLNNMLQGKWAVMGQETERCICNTVLGVGGFFDLATQWGIPRSDAGFGQTFTKWGWKPGAYLMLPVFGPSDVRDGVGLAGDAAANPMTYFFPFSWISSGVKANDFTDTVEGSVRFSQAEPDSYSLLHLRVELRAPKPEGGYACNR